MAISYTYPPRKRDVLMQNVVVPLNVMLLAITTMGEQGDDSSDTLRISISSPNNHFVQAGLVTLRAKIYFGIKCEC